MWLCFNNAFVSAVADRDDPNRLMVRARRREHLVNLFGADADIIEGAGTDYKYRVFIERRVLADLAHKTLMSLGYDNFKNSVKDDDLHDLYSDFWELHYEMQK
ncbi:hypothetical protein [Microvirga massiliensis]|uniref:hypothetical protein n=1 Tax=Microvirga massiliensis TaxID=1033741 RepID=UPI00062B4151|nr:hypothetical protein [Microvirga massiliensis]